MQPDTMLSEKSDALLKKNRWVSEFSQTLKRVVSPFGEYSLSRTNIALTLNDDKYKVTLFHNSSQAQRSLKDVKVVLRSLHGIKDAIRIGLLPPCTSTILEESAFDSDSLNSYSSRGDEVEIDIDEGIELPNRSCSEIPLRSTTIKLFLNVPHSTDTTEPGHFPWAEMQIDLPTLELRMRNIELSSNGDEERIAGILEERGDEQMNRPLSLRVLLGEIKMTLEQLVSVRVGNRLVFSLPKQLTCSLLLADDQIGSTNVTFTGDGIELQVKEFL